MHLLKNASAAYWTEWSEDCSCPEGLAMRTRECMAADGPAPGECRGKNETTDNCYCFIPMSINLDCQTYICDGVRCIFVFSKLGNRLNIFIIGRG